MIFGIGTDIVDLERIKAMKAPLAFAKKILGPDELPHFIAVREGHRLAYLGKQFAAKEAIVKAFGTGFRAPLFPQTIQILRDHSGKPEVVYSKEAKSYAESLGINKSHVSLCDERNHLIAFAILEG